MRVLYGRWAGRVGVLDGYHRNGGRTGGQQPQEYPVVKLDAQGRARARTVRVLTVKPEDT